MAVTDDEASLRIKVSSSRAACAPSLPDFGLWRTYFCPCAPPAAAAAVQGALFNDGVSGLFSALATSLPLTTFAQNNGVISLTNVAARQSGWACGLWLILLGILGKVGGCRGGDAKAAAVRLLGCCMLAWSMRGPIWLAAMSL
ncbi:solute carrier family 23 protein [Bosea sp. (in: a-proteobacteria)]|uniref:solute carrier family 23 protein n=1 Tax=Bosea sp. (in: a-proteobacteria) TaxID=1871050 RepID=UPI0040344B79